MNSFSKFLLLGLTTVLITGNLKGQSSKCYDDLLPKRSLQNGKMGFADLFDNWIINPKYFEVFPFEGRFAKVRHGNTYGMINCEGEEIIPPEFDELGFFHWGKIWCKKPTGWLLYDSIGNQLTETPFTSVERISKWNSLTWIQIDNKWRVFDESNHTVVCEKSFSTHKLLSDSLSLVADHGYFAIMDNRNCEYTIDESIVSAKKLSAYAIMVQYKNRAYDIINPNGKSILKSPYNDIKGIGFGRAAVLSQKKWGMINGGGEVILPCQFDTIMAFASGLAPIKQNDTWYYVNPKGEIDRKYAFQLALPFWGGRAMVKKENGWHLIDNKFQKRTASFDSLTFYEKKYFVLSNKLWHFMKGDSLSVSFASSFVPQKPEEAVRAEISGNWGIYNMSNKMWPITPKYDSVGRLFNNLAFVKKGENYGIAHIDNKTCLELEYDNIEYITGLRPELFIIKKSNKWGVVGCNSKPIIPLEFNNLHLRGQFLESKKDGDYQLFDFEGREIDHPDYDSMIPITTVGPIIYLHKDKWGLFDKKGEALLKNDFIDARILSENYIGLQERKENLWAIYDASGTLRIPHQHASCPVIFGDGFFVSSGNNYTWLSKKDKAFLPDSIEDYLIEDDEWAWLKIKGKWHLARSYGKIADEKAFDTVKNIDGKLIAKRSDKSFQLINGELKPYLPFD